MKELVILTEELSAKDLLEGLLPRLLPEDWIFRCISYEGKQDLEKRMGFVLRAWKNPEARFVVLRDQDSGDCRTIKAGLLQRCRDAGQPDALIRIACRELEAWVLGDLIAFSEEFSAPAAGKAVGKAKFRNPDALGSAVAELRKFVPGYQKRDGGRRMGKRLDPKRNMSPSFRTFCDGILRIAA
ncbi:MAG: DUF4276 family protein [Azonexus sp.]|jgi:hypothetical protein|nr:DUF4276 family protein [Azonexus sp.]